MKKLLWVIGIISISWFISGCSGSKGALSPETQAEFDAMKNMVELQGKEIAKLTKMVKNNDVSTLKKEIKTIKKESETLKTELRRTRAGLMNMQTSIDNIQGSSPLIDSTNRIILDDIQYLKSQLKNLSERTSSMDIPASLAGVQNKTAKKISPREFKNAYVNTLSKFQNGHYADARATFQDLISSDPSNDLADNAQYWIGESYYMEKKYDRAIIEFEKVFTYSAKDKYDDSQFKLGLCYRKLGNNKKAKEEFERLINYYKDSEYYTQSQKILNNIK